MIEQYIQKVNNDKYHNSIRYFSHSLKGDIRRDFIRNIADQNILLASQCIMSCERDVELEQYLAQMALEISKGGELRNKVEGILAIIELNRYDLIEAFVQDITRVDIQLRRAISEVLSFISCDNFIMLLKVISSNQKIISLVNIFIKFAKDRNFMLNNKQKDELIDIYNNMNFKKGHVAKYKYLIVFDLPYKCFKYNLKSHSERFIMRGKYHVITEFCDYYNIPPIFSNNDICDILLTSSNKQCRVFLFAEILFKIKSETKRFQLIRRAYLRGKYFKAFVYSLVKSHVERKPLINNEPDKPLFSKLIAPFERKNYPEVNQEKLINLIHELQSHHNKDIDFDSEILENNLETLEKKVHPKKRSVVKCVVCHIIPKTIFVDIQPDNIKGSIWVNEYSDEYIEDANTLVKIGDELDAMVIGYHEKYIRLSVKRLKDGSEDP